MIGKIDGDKLVKELIDLAKEYHQLSNDLILRDGGSHEFENDVCVTSGKSDAYLDIAKIIKLRYKADKCRWQHEIGGAYHFYYCGCNHTEYQEEAETDWKFCPHCGKEIEPYE